MLLDFDETSKVAPAKGKASRKLIGVALFSVMAVLGQTFAANINIGTSQGAEFGQGIQATTACSGSSPITMRPNTTFANSTGAGSMKFSSIEVSGIPSSCAGSKFIFTAYNETSTAALPIYNTNQSAVTVIMKSDNTFVSALSASGITVTTLSSSSFKVEFNTPVSTSTLVYRVTVESQKATCAEGSTCVIGDIGPGGGLVFLTPSSPGNASGYYFEIAPMNVAGTYNLCLTEPITISGITTIGQGDSLTAALMQNSSCNTSTNAAYAAVNYSGGGKSDWFLPTKDELKAARDNVRTLYTNWTGQYFTSTQNDSRGVWVVDFSANPCGGTGLCTAYKNSTAQGVRPVRKF